MEDPAEVKDEVKDRACCCGVSVGLYNVIVVGLCMLVLFTAFNPVQSLQAPLARNGSGFKGIGILYGTFSAATLVSSQLVRIMGQKLGLFLGGVCYLLYISTILVMYLTTPSDTVYLVCYYLASGVIGAGAALLWTSQGSIVTVMASPSTLGFYNGVFWAMFMVNYVAGGLITQFVINSSGAILLYTVFSSLAALGVLGMLALRSTPSLQRQRGSQIQFRILETVKLLWDVRYRFLWPATMYSGFSAAFFNSILTAYMGKEWVGYSLVIFGGAEVVGSLAGGRLSDRIGRTPVFLFACVCTMTGVCFAALSKPAQLDNPTYYFLAYAFLGLGDSGFNTQVQGAIGHYFASESQPAFAGYRFLLSVCAMIGSLGGQFLTPEYLSPPWPILVPALVLWTNLFFAILCWIYLDWRIQPVFERTPSGYAEVISIQEEPSK